GLEKHPMRALYGYDVVAELRPGTRYDQVVAALGGHGELVTDPEEIGPAIDRALAAGVPALVNVLTDPADVYPRSSAPIEPRRGPGRATGQSRGPAFSRNRSLETITRVKRPAATRPRSSVTEIRNTRRRPSTASSTASARTLAPTGVGARWLISTRCSTALVPGSSRPARAAQVACSARRMMLGVASMGTSDVPAADDVSRSLTTCSIVP